MALLVRKMTPIPCSDLQKMDFLLFLHAEDLGCFLDPLLMEISSEYLEGYSFALDHPLNGSDQHVVSLGFLEHRWSSGVRYLRWFQILSGISCSVNFHSHSISKIKFPTSELSFRNLS
ncbi:hypothetical protein TNCT_181421 [Trichonephila clavata]|uniref:Uncharacterized protein n=1 Tax=Trichonephila clavata TaxID=2740835 RepID=A0A8X6J295_TRICU|nr:hypothetical protein TNCT_181421 [Trichonephila clavata]